MAFYDSTHDSLYRNSLKYEFTTEMAPGVWKIYRKRDRMEFLAHDVTDQLFTENKKGGLQETLLSNALSPSGYNLIAPLLTVLNHANLMSLVDVFALEFSGSGKLARASWFIVWDYCDAGNLGNLLMPGKWRPNLPGQKKDPFEGVEQLLMHDWYDLNEEYRGPPRGKEPRVERTTFLPESLCWHVLLSVLKALAYLHDGARELHQHEDGEFCMSYVEGDWQPMLHRNVKAANIFLSHPKRGEWYGACKLGNYSELVITGHFQGYEGEGNDDPITKAMAPSPGTKFTPMEELVAEDEKRGALYPPQPGQPYTMVSEYRALVKVIVAMMVTPGTINHEDDTAEYWVADSLKWTDYSRVLKNFVVKIHQIDPWKDIKEPFDPKKPKQYGSSYVTSDLFCQAMDMFEYYRQNSVEGAKTIPGDAAARLQAEQDAAEQGIVNDSLGQVHRIVQQMDPSKLAPPSKTI